MKIPWPILNVAEMRAAEAAIFASGVEDYALMQRAGQAAAPIIWRAGGTRPTLVLCGPGNNGGDGYVIARALAEVGVPVRVAASADPVTSSAKRARADWGGPVEDFMTAHGAAQMVDALFGIGLTRGLEEDLALRLADLARTAERAYAIDVPSGVASDSGDLLSPVPRFDVCIALGALKPAHVLRPAANSFAQLHCCDIGVDVADVRSFRLMKPRLAPPADDAHKYKRGMVAVVAGEMPGAAALSAQAAAHGGAGYVKLFGAQAIIDTPHAIVRASLRDEAALADPRIGALLIGPGLGRGDKAMEMFQRVTKLRLPGVVDADGLHLMRTAGLPVLPDKTILTPHAGEFAHLFPDITGTVIEQARMAATRSGAVIVLKGPTSVIAAPDGRTIVADRASRWLSTAGTGDVLAGLCASRLAVTGDPFLAASEAVWLHGEAARLAGEAFIADDLIRYIPLALGACL